jgi:hypothetical protein
MTDNNKKILNLTQHTATMDQVAEGVYEVREEFKGQKVQSLNFETKPSATEIWQRATLLAKIAACHDARVAMIGGAPYLMGPLERALEEMGIAAVYAFTERVSAEEIQADGSVKKVSSFKHSGFVGI